MPSTWTASSPMADQWGVCALISVILIVAAVIDGYKLKVPNWITLPLIVSGWIVSGVLFGWSGLAWSLVGTGVGLALLLPAYAIGGMGAGDVKLLAGVGAFRPLTPRRLFSETPSRRNMHKPQPDCERFAAPPTVIIGAIQTTITVSTKSHDPWRSSRFFLNLRV